MSCRYKLGMTPSISYPGTGHIQYELLQVRQQDGKFVVSLTTIARDCLKTGQPGLLQQGTVSKQVSLDYYSKGLSQNKISKG